MKPILFAFIFSFFIIVSGYTTQAQPYLWETTRGVNISTEATEQDIADLSEWGANHVRMSFPVEPFMDLII
jgi:hypothetical protein